MKKLFTAIQKNDHGTVAALLDKSSELIGCVHQGNPKKFDGQSPLQVALKTADTQTVELLLTYQPDVNFMEQEPCANDWRAPVLHDAINRAIMATRWNVRRTDGLEVFNTQAQADEAFTILKKLIELGADVNAQDSYGNAGMDRACLQARHNRAGKDGRLRSLAYLLRSRGDGRQMLGIRLGCGLLSVLRGRNYCARCLYGAKR